MNKALSFFGCLLLSLPGCMVGPDYEQPKIAMPAQFSENKENQGCTDEELCRWWKLFDDPLLDSLIEEAAFSNYDVRIAIEQIAQARSQYRVQRSYLWPEIDLNATAVRSRFSQNVFATAANAESLASGNVASPTTTVGKGSFGPPVQNFFQVGFDSIWELDFWGKFRRGKRAAHDQWEASGFTAQNVLITTVSEVAKNYVSIRALQQQIILEKEKIESLERQLELGLVLFDAGLDNEIQVETLLATLESEKAALPVLQTSLKQTIYALAVLLGKDPEALLDTFEEAGPIPVGAARVPAGLPSDLLRRRPDIRAAERQLAAATEQIGVNVANLFPHISLTGDAFGYEGNKPSNWFKPPSKYWSIGPSINWDLIDFGRTRAQIAIANSLQRQSLLSYELTVISSLQDVEGALVAYFEEEKRNRFLSQQVEADFRALVLTEDLFQSGLEDESQVLQALSTFLNAQSSLIQSDQALTTDLIAVYKALGGGLGMYFYALKMLFGDRIKYIGLVVALAFASFIISQQGAIFVGIMKRTFSFITDTSQPDLWVMDPTVQYIDDLKGMKETVLYRVRSIEGIQWAVPLYKGLIQARLQSGNFQTCIFLGIDDATLIGGPPTMVEGNIFDLRFPDAVIVDQVGSRTKLASEGKKPGDPVIPLQVGDVMELNDRRAYVAGICQTSRTFQSQPVVYTTYDNATSIAPLVRDVMTFVLVKANPGVDVEKLAERITQVTGYAAYTTWGFQKLTMVYYAKYTGIVVNFAVAIILGFIIGVAIAGQTFFNFTLDNLAYLGTFKAMGAQNSMLVKMVIYQSLVVSLIGWGIGIGAAAVFGWATRYTELSFSLPWWLYLISCFSLLVICFISALFSMIKVVRLDPAIVFKS